MNSVINNNICMLYTQISNNRDIVDVTYTLMLPIPFVNLVKIDN